MPFITTVLDQNNYFKKTTQTYIYIDSYDSDELGTLSDMPVDNMLNSIIYADSDATVELDSVSCWTASSISNRPDAFRCMTNQNTISDPCFLDPYDNSIVSCPDDPYRKVKYYITDNKQFNDERMGTSIDEPWYIILFNGNECRFVTGATKTIAGDRMDYFCNDTKKNEFLSLPLEKNDSVMTIKCATEGRIQDCMIKEAWY